jgi:hypothetical protein
MSTKSTKATNKQAVEVATSETGTGVTFTPYGASVVANKVLKDRGIEKVLPPQMFYNYTTGRARKGKNTLIPTVEVEGQLRITEAGLTEWLEKYIARKQAATTSTTSEA